MKNNNILAIIPARGGSKGIPRKNIRFLVGKPLINYSIENALKSKYINNVVVSTDDEEIAHISEMAGAKTIKRPDFLAEDDVTLDPVIFHALIESEKLYELKYDYVITLQPTSPLLSSLTLDKAIEKIVTTGIDTLISVVDNRHLTWGKKDNKYIPNYKERKNRQYLPPNFLETGSFLISKRIYIRENNRFGKSVDLFEIPKKEANDIDTQMDWWITEKLLNQKKIFIRVDGYREIGLGHIYRTLLLANRLIDHELVFVSNKKYDLGIELIMRNNYKIITFNNEKEFYNILLDYKPDIIINDILDTSKEYIQSLKRNNFFVCNFEDMGKGAKYADVVFNALYEEKYLLANHYWGKDYFCLREEFYLAGNKEITNDVNEILITFGGIDSNNYTNRILKILTKINISSIKKITVILGMGYKEENQLQTIINNSKMDVGILKNVKNISKYMLQADLIFTSAGRTVYEIASIGTPTIVMAQNNRELRHTFANSKNGFINLELGYKVTDQNISETALEIIGDFEMRKLCNKRMLANNLKYGVNHILEKIFSVFEKSRED